MTSADIASLYEQTRTAMRGPDARQALSLASELCRAAPEIGEYQRIAGITALAAEHSQEARTYFTSALRLDQTPLAAAAAWSGIGHAALLEEDWRGAANAFHRALSLEPHFAPAFAGLGEAQLGQSYNKPARESLREAIRLGMNDSKTQILLGRALLGCGEVETAREAFDTARNLAPQAAAPRFLLGTVAKVEGRIEEARRIYREVLEATPDYPGYGEFAALKTFSEHDEDITVMRNCLAALPEDTPAGVRADLHFALAKALDDSGDIAGASEHLRTANGLDRQRFPQDSRTHIDRMARIAKLFTREFIHRGEATGFVAMAPIFVVSLPRSGSTLMEQMLASHSQINGGGEIAHFGHVATELSLRWGERDDFPNIPDGVAADDLLAAGREYDRLTATLRLLTPYFTDKSLINIQYIGLIRMMLPNAHVIHMRRHPLAVALGVYRQRFTRAIAYSLDLEAIVRHYRAYSRLMDHWRDVVPEAFTEVFYEALIADPERELRRVFDYVGVDFEPACLDFYRLERPVRTASVVQVREPLNSRGLRRHERYRELLAPVAEGLAAEIAAYESDLEAAMQRSSNAVT